ncbi:hypothetical protein CO683_00670 [Bradyrhizobium ottawaense]|uniref:hypothetical protein n=1 Tax=Bradyrhizobium ottawaense TaxID=931866 RepID=UPI000BE9DA37|nr:hypothetical protein [Bradyrhizobium ottawaense]PDT71705.1 hypothetical protein CO683_00670 [Bradyrhizobium ottawaense]
MSTFCFEFDELPLVISNGIPAGLINGCAEIKYSRDGEWEIDSVSVEGYQNLTSEQRAAGKKPWIYVAAPWELGGIIYDRLMGEWNDKVSDAIREQIESDRQAAAEYRAEMRREDRYTGAF